MDYLKKFQNSRKHAPFASLTLRDCGNRSEFAVQILTLFEISCADIAVQIGFFCKLKAISEFYGRLCYFIMPQGKIEASRHAGERHAESSEKSSI